MTTLSDRYVWAVLRAVPESQRIELELELRALVADAIEARAGADSADAERAALVELGDPEQLAARYAGRRLTLIGPAVFPAWRRLAATLLAVVVPIVAVVTLGSSLLAESTAGETVVRILGSSWLAASMVLFWVTLIFAGIEWTGATRSIPELNWSPDRLPDVPGVQRIGVAELLGALITSVFVAAFIIWQQVRPPTVDGTETSILDPALWSFWLPYFLVVTCLEIAFTFVVYLRGRWTYLLAAVNAGLSLAFAVPALWLLLTGQLFNPALVDALDRATGNDWLQPTVIITALTIGVIVAWDGVDAFLKAHRNAQLDSARPAAA
ncbi:MAG TPA: hypothetical protein VFO05_09920 [Candidatus Limnocylindrales bacterium]|nr:hypothetical protein [Candidatus Limnocylindrales bacterium]